MDIQKVKELALINGFKLKEQASGNMDLNAYVYDFANAIEREVRAQADQKVKLLLCDEHLKKCESPTGIFNSQYPDEEPCLICLAKEAKAQAVPEGYILIPKKMPDEVNDHLWDFMTDNFVCTNDYGDSFMACDDFNLDKFYAELVKAQEPAND